jgi:hypothetical protein
MEFCDTLYIDTGVWYDGVGSTLGDEAHRLGQVTPMRAQQPHVQSMSPAKAHMVKISTVTKHWGRMRIESARHAIYFYPCYGHHDTALLYPAQEVSQRTHLDKQVISHVGYSAVL